MGHSVSDTLCPISILKFIFFSETFMMVRNRKRKTEIGLTDPEKMKAAVLRVINENRKVRSLAKEMDINRTTLQRYVNKYKAASEEERRTLSYRPNYSVNKVLACELEEDLVQYIIDAANMHHGLTRKQVMKFGYQLAIANNYKIPNTWHINKSAGLDWFYEFKKRHPVLSVRKPEGTSLARATAFNRSTVKMFFDNLEEVYSKFGENLSPGCIYNLDETALTTVHNPPKIVAKKGQKQVGQVTSGERGVLVTACCIISASGSAVPPCLIFPRVHYKDHMIKGAPVGTTGFATKTGWMNGDIFLEVLKHFQKNTRATLENKVILIIDNHESHITIGSLNFCKKNGIILVSLPPHTSNKLQPLDCTVFKSFKTAFNIACNDWMLTNPGKMISIYEIAGLCGQAYEISFTPKNISRGFEVTGIWPFNRNVFSEIDYLGAKVTDRPIPDSDSKFENCSSTSNTDKVLENTANHADSLPSIPVADPTQKPPVKEIVKPQEIRPFPRAAPRKNTSKNRKRKSEILTNTPIKDAICEELEMKIRRNDLKKKNVIKRKVFLEPKVTHNSSSSENDSDDNISLCDDTSSNLSSIDTEEDPAEISFDQNIEFDINDYVLVKEGVGSHKIPIYSVGKITEQNQSEYKILHLKPTKKGNFVANAVFEFSRKDIQLAKLPNPRTIGKTSRTAEMLTFPLQFDSYNIRY